MNVCIMLYEYWAQKSLTMFYSKSVKIVDQLYKNKDNFTVMLPFQRGSHRGDQKPTECAEAITLVH